MTSYVVARLFGLLNGAKHILLLLTLIMMIHVLHTNNDQVANEPIASTEHTS